MLPAGPNRTGIRCEHRSCLGFLCRAPARTGPLVEHPSCHHGIGRIRFGSRPCQDGAEVGQGLGQEVAEILQEKEKQKWQRIQGAIQSAWEEHGATMSVGDMRAMVGHTLGLSLDGEYRVRFDKALSQITSPPPQRRHKRCRFTIASNGARHQKTKT